MSKISEVKSLRLVTDSFRNADTGSIRNITYVSNFIDPNGRKIITSVDTNSINVIRSTYLKLIRYIFDIPLFGKSFFMSKNEIKARYGDLITIQLIFSQGESEIASAENCRVEVYFGDDLFLGEFLSQDDIKTLQEIFSAAGLKSFGFNGSTQKWRGV